MSTILRFGMLVSHHSASLGVRTAPGALGKNGSGKNGDRFIFGGLPESKAKAPIDDSERTVDSARFWVVRGFFPCRAPLKPSVIALSTAWRIVPGGKSPSGKG